MIFEVINVCFTDVTVVPARRPCPDSRNILNTNGILQAYRNIHTRTRTDQYKKSNNTIIGFM